MHDLPRVSVEITARRGKLHRGSLICQHGFCRFNTLAIGQVAEDDEHVPARFIGRDNWSDSSYCLKPAKHQGGNCTKAFSEYVIGRLKTV